MADLEEMVCAAQRGEIEAFARLVRHYYGAVLRVCAGYVRETCLAEDLVQETFLRAFVHLDELRSPEGFWPWLRQVARNTSLMALREARGREGVSAGEAAEYTSPPLEESNTLVLRDLVHRSLANLPENYRLPLYLHYLLGSSYREISELLNVPEALVRSRLHEGRRRLRRKLQGAAREVLRQAATIDPDVEALVARCGEAACRCGQVLRAP